MVSYRITQRQLNCFKKPQIKVMNYLKFVWDTCFLWEKVSKRTRTRL